MTTTVTEELWDDTDGRRLRDEMAVELAERYGFPDLKTDESTADTVSVFLVARDSDGNAVGCGGMLVLDDGAAEVKRMYVTPTARGTGVATSILRALVDHARWRELGSIVLSTGTGQPDAIRFYEREGYQPIDAYGVHANHPMARCFTLELS